MLEMITDHGDNFCLTAVVCILV